jgi:hypothetical protein
MKRRAMMKKDILENSHVLWAGALISVVMCVANATAAPAGKARVNRTVFNPVTAKPVWVSTATATRMDPMLIDAMQQMRVTSGNGDGPLVIVPPRPAPRSPFMPPSRFSPGDLPPWVLVGQP